MTSAYEPPSSPAVHGSSLEEELAYYKAQYEQLEVELQEFQASSRELEAELEKDVEASEKRERQLKEKVEGLGFEVEEWKVSISILLTAVMVMGRFSRLGADTRCRQSTNSPKPRPPRRRTHCRKRSRSCAIRIGRSSSNSATSK